MSLPFSLKIALRLNQSKKITILVSFVSFISICSIAIGVAILIVCLSAINGFEYEFKNRILSVIPHGQIHAVNQPYLNWHYDLLKIKNTPGVVGVSPYIYITAVLEKNNILQTLQIIGADLISETLINSLPKFISHNAWKKLKTGSNEIIIGQGIAKKLRISIGENITIMFPSYDNNLHTINTNAINFSVIGLLKLNGILDNQLAIIPLKDAQRYLSYGTGITGFKINVTNIFNVNDIIYNAALNVNNSVNIKTWINDYGYVYNDIKTVRCIMYLTMVFLIAISCFNVIFTLMISIKNKKKYIAILKTIGASNTFIGKVFIWYGLIIGIVGCFIGLCIGIFISLYLSSIIKYIEYIIGYHFLSSNVYFIDFMPSKLNYIDICYVILITLVLSLMASYYPAKFASKIDPVKILGRYNN